MPESRCSSKTARKIPWLPSVAFLSTTDGVNDCDERVDLDGLAVQNGGFVTPLLNRLQRRVDEKRVTADDLQRLNRSIRGNDGPQFHATPAASLSRRPRIGRLHPEHDNA